MSQEKHIKVFDISPKKIGTQSVSVKIGGKEEIKKVELVASAPKEKKEIIREIIVKQPKEKLQPFQEQKQTVNQEQVESEQQQAVREAGKEFLSKWFYKKKEMKIQEELLKQEQEEKEKLQKETLTGKPDKKIKEELNEEEEEDFLKNEIKPAIFKFSRYVFLFLILIIIGGGIYVAVKILPKADIKITMKKIAWSFNDGVSASKNIGETDLTNKQIPANFFLNKKNISLSYPATGKRHIEKKAEGEITIYNAYSSQPQFLVVNTRFESSNGRIFRIQEKITVPGAKVENGKIAPSVVKAKVVADKVGVEYNIGPAKFTIPGFKGTPKYEGFYAKSENSMVGGFIGEMFYPTDDEIKTAKEKTEAALKENLKMITLSQIPDGFKIIEGAQQFNVAKEEVDYEVKDGNFSIFAEGELVIAGFKESDLLRLIDGLAIKDLGEGFKPKDYSLEYGVGRLDSQNGKLSFPIDYKGTFWQHIDAEQFKKLILNVKESELKAKVFSLNGVERATISLWPFWVKKVPENINKVKVEIE